jgi:hypothetical protein
LGESTRRCDVTCEQTTQKACNERKDDVLIHRYISAFSFPRAEDKNCALHYKSGLRPRCDGCCRWLPPNDRLPGVECLGNET